MARRLANSATLGTPNMGYSGPFRSELGDLIGQGAPQDQPVVGTRPRNFAARLRAFARRYERSARTTAASDPNRQIDLRPLRTVTDRAPATVRALRRHQNERALQRDA
jgi:hypothetical protein